MFISRFLRFRYFAVLVLVLVLMASFYAFAAANVVPESGTGDGSGTISGYTISNITYDLTTDGDPSNIDKVTFNIAPTAGALAPATVQVELNGGGTWIGCTNTVGTTWECNVAGAVTTLAASSLRVVAAQ